MQKHLIDQTGKVNTGTTGNILEQLEALRETLDAIEQKVEPTAAPIPDTFNMATLYASPFNKLADQVAREAEAFDDYLARLWSNVSIAARAPVAAKNLPGWEKSFEHLARAWHRQIASLRNNVDAVKEFAQHMIFTTAVACECDANALQSAIEQGASHD